MNRLSAKIVINALCSSLTRVRRTDGTPSVVVKPYSMICFGDIAPCAGNEGGGSSSVSREAILISRGAQEGTYYIFAAYCYSVEFKLAFGSVFPIELVRS